MKKTNTQFSLLSCITIQREWCTMHECVDGENRLASPTPVGLQNCDAQMDLRQTTLSPERSSWRSHRILHRLQQLSRCVVEAMSFCLPQLPEPQTLALARLSSWELEIRRVLTAPWHGSHGLVTSRDKSLLNTWHSLVVSILISQRI